MFGSLGFPELIMIFVVALLVFGPRKLPEIGRSLGKALGEFKKATEELKNTIQKEVQVDELKQLHPKEIVRSVTRFDTPAAPGAQPASRWPEPPAAGAEVKPADSAAQTASSTPGEAPATNVRTD
jgi:TatA/E family protein of Tat protein translocase